MDDRLADGIATHGPAFARQILAPAGVAGRGVLDQLRQFVGQLYVDSVWAWDGGADLGASDGGRSADAAGAALALGFRVGGDSGDVSISGLAGVVDDESAAAADGAGGRPHDVHTDLSDSEFPQSDVASGREDRRESEPIDAAEYPKARRDQQRDDGRQDQRG